MKRSPQQLLEDARAIWLAGVDAVRGDRVIERGVRAVEGGVEVGDAWVSERDFDSILVLGAGKAGSAMVTGLERALAPLAERKSIYGWVNVPDETVVPTRWIHLHPARPQARNLPTQAGCDGTEQILRLATQANQRTWCLVLISGGGSALLPAPIPGISLADKIELTQLLSSSGVDIVELNAVRRAISLIKGGGLLRALRAGRVDTLVISDVLGDPAASIASGPTIESTDRYALALEVLDRFERAETHELFGRVRKAIKQRESGEAEASASCVEPSSDSRRQAPTHAYHLLANLAEAIDAAGIEAERRGYDHAMTGATKPEPNVSEVAERWVRVSLGMLKGSGPNCWISGGEPTVNLAPAEIRGRGGRNQQLVLEAWERLRTESPDVLHDLVMLSGGTDGEDGVTSAAGAWIDGQVDARGRAMNLNLHDYRIRNDGFSLFEQTGGLLITGPTHTNVCDLRVVVVNRESQGHSTATDG